METFKKNIRTLLTLFNFCGLDMDILIDSFLIYINTDRDNWTRKNGEAYFCKNIESETHSFINFCGLDMDILIDSFLIYINTDQKLIYL